MKFHADELVRFVRSSDLKLDPTYDNADGAERLSADSAMLVAQGFPALQLKTISVREKTAYILEHAPSLVVLRAINSELCDGVVRGNAERDTIIRQLHSILQEGVHHRVYKLDIRSFFESVDTSQLVVELMNDQFVDRSTALLVRDFVGRVGAAGVQGVPRGLPLSGTLAEYVLAAFDHHLSALNDVYFYARFVDDIIIVTGGREAELPFKRALARILPKGMIFNPSKTVVLDLPVNKNGLHTTRMGVLDFLGYRFHVSDTARIERKLCRRVDLVIAPKKLRRLKTRICRSFAAYLRDGKTDLLHRRLQMLSGNYNVRDFITMQNRNVGLFCSYRHVTDFSNLADVDKLLIAILSGNKNKLSRKVAAKLGAAEAGRLLRYSFKQSFQRRPFYNFDIEELTRLRSCWRDA